MIPTLDPLTYYHNLCKEVTDELCLAMLQYMIDNDCIGEKHRVSRAHLANALLGKVNDRNDRKIRRAKAILVKEKGVPILSSSGSKGYYLAEFQDEIDGLIQENNNRITSLMEQNQAIRKVKLPYLPPDHIKQNRLWGKRL